MKLCRLRAALAVTTALVSTALADIRPAAALSPTPPGGAVYVILPGATATAATVAMQMPSGVPIAVGVLNPTTGTFTPSGLTAEQARAVAAEARALQTANAFSEIAAAGSSAQATARTNLGLGTAATMNVTKDATGVASGAVDPIARSAVQPGSPVDTNTALGRTTAARIGDVANVLDAPYGALCNAVKTNGTWTGTDDTGAIRAAVATGLPVLIPTYLSGAPHACLVSGTLTPANGQTIGGYGGKPTIALVSSTVTTLFDLGGKTNVTLRDFIADGSGATASNPAPFIKLNAGATGNRVLIDLLNPTGSGSVAAVNISGGSTSNVYDGTITNSAGIAVNITGSTTQSNVIHGHTRNNGNFGVRIGEGANRNEVSGMDCITSVIECYATASQAYLNRFVNDYAEGSGDNGFSNSGYANTFVSDVAYKNAKAGIYSWGGLNIITGFMGRDNNQLNGAVQWPCIGVNANYGGTGQGNNITGSTCDDDQATPTQYGITFGATAYTPWAAGQTVTAGQYETSGLGIYQAQSAGTTGSTAPTGTGTVSDGTISWTLVNTFVTDTTSGYNIDANNRVLRYAGSAPHSDSGGYRTNTLITPGQNNMTGQLLLLKGTSPQASQSYTSANTVEIHTGTTDNPGLVFDTANPTAVGAITFGYNGTSLSARLAYDFGGAFWSWFAQGLERIRMSGTQFRPVIDNAMQSGTTATSWASFATWLTTMRKNTAAPTTAIGAGAAQLFVTAGTNAGTCKLQMIAGTSTTPVTIVDNVGGGC